MRFLGLLALALLLGATLPVGAQEGAPERAREADPLAPLELADVEYLVLDDVHPGVDGGPFVDLYFRALTRYRLPVNDLRIVDLAVLQDGVRIPERQLLSLRRLDEAELGLAGVVALDASRTMMGGPLDAAREAALGFLEHLGPADRVAILAFSDHVEEVSGFDASDEERREKLAALAAHHRAMSTRVYDAIYQAARLLRDTPGLPRRTFAVVFSDGRDGGSEHGFEEVVEVAGGGVSEPRIPIFTIGYTGRGADGLAALRRLSARTGADSTRAVDLAAFYEDVLHQMRSSYVLRFETAMDGAPHEIVLDVEGHADGRLAAYPAVFRSQSAVWSPTLLAGVTVAAIFALLVASRIRRAREAACLRFRSGPRAGEAVKLRGERVRIGALDENDVQIELRTVSRFHAEIRRDDGAYTLIDLDSTNGTRVNGARITRAPLSPGDVVRFGEVEMTFEVGT